MKLEILMAGAFASALALGSTPGYALTVDFTLTDSSNIVVTGEIDGLNANSNSPPSEVYITGYTLPTQWTGWYTFPTPLLVSPTLQNTWSVDPSGAITQANFYGQANFGTNNYVDLSLTWDLAGTTYVGGLFQYTSSPECSQQFGCGQTGGDYSLSMTPAPLPAALPMFASGYGVMNLFGTYRKKRIKLAA